MILLCAQPAAGGTGSPELAPTGGAVSGRLAFDIEAEGAGRALPRPYQAACIEAVMAARDAGVRRALITQPTGAGKTSVFTWIIQQWPERGPALILAHRDELLEQAAARVRTLAPELLVGIEKAERRAVPGCDVVVASIQTVGRERSFGRLAWLVRAGLALVVCDECHHSTAASYRALFERLGCFAADGPFLLGCTATPHRADRQHLAAVYEREVYRYELRQAIREGWLCPVRCYRVETGQDISQVHVQGGDFQTGELAREINRAERTMLAWRHWQEVAGERKTLLFCADVKHARDAARLFREQGVASEHVDGEMPLPLRRAILERLRRGQTQVVANCAVLTEGFDLPELAAIVMLRPTKSQALYTQCVGRGMRPALGKADLVVLDLVDNCRRHSLVTAPVLFGLPASFNLAGAQPERIAQQLEACGLEAERLAAGEETVDLARIQSRIQEWELFGVPELPASIAALTGLRWLPCGDGYRLECGAGRVARVDVDAVGQFTASLWLFEELRARRGGIEDAAAAFARADAGVKKVWPDALGLVREEAPWVTEPATAKQVAFLRKQGATDLTLAGLTKGRASSIISRLIGRSPATPSASASTAE